MKKSLFFFALLLAAVFSNAQNIVFHENFETPSNGDSVTASGTSNFVINTRLFNSGAQCDSNYVAVGGLSYLTTNSFSTVGNSVVYLKFSHICKMQIEDTAKVEISVNGGPWVKLTTQYINQSGSGSQFTAQAYHFCAGTYPLVWLPGSPTTKPAQSWWKTEMFDISALAANQSDVRVRFTLRDNGDGGQGNMGWYIDDINVLASISELFPPTLVMKTPIIQDTVFNTGPFDIYAYIKDASGIDTAYIVYQLNNGANQYIPMHWVSDSTYLGTIPSYSYNNRVDYHVYAADNSASHNFINGANLWFYIKHGPPEVIIGTGTVTTNNYYPFYNRYENNRTQMLYKASEINKSGSITNMAFNLSYITADLTKRHLLNFTIKIKPTTLTTLGAAYADMTSATTVFSSADFYQMTALGWYTFDITDYPYDGTSNLIIEVLFGDDGAYSASGDAYNVYRTDYSSGSDILVVYGYADSETPPAYDGNSKIRPNIKLTFPATNYTQDAGVKQLLSPSGNVTAGVNLPVNLYLQNFGSDSLKKVNIAWKLDGVLQQSFSWTGVLLQDVVSSSLNIGDVNVTAGPHIIKAWTELPNDSADQNHSNDTASISFYACANALSGNYTVGGVGADFPTFVDVQTALNNCGVSGPVVFKINSGTYKNQLVFNAITGASATNTITFMPNTGATVVIYDSTSTSTIKLNGTDYFIFDGSNNGTTSRDMTIINNSTASSTAAIWLASAGTGQGCVGVTIKNCIIKSGAKSSDIYGVIIGGSTIGSAGADNDSVVIQNNDISKAYFGVWAQGVTGGLNDNMQILNNIIGSDVAADYIGHNGIYLTYGASCLVQKNKIYNIVAASTTPVGISIYTGMVSTSVIKNNIYNITSTGTGGYGGRAIFVNTGNASSNLVFANNIIYMIGGDGYTGFSGSSPVGMYFDGTTGGLKIYYNSVYMSGNLTYSGATKTTAILFNTTTITGIIMKNNIFQNSMINTASTTAKNYAIYSTAPNTSFSASNNNDYYVSGTQGVLGYLGADLTTLAALKTATAHDTNSININPGFFSTTDLHTFASGINAHGIPVSVTDDIDGNPRDASTPDIGAYEFTIPNYSLGIISVVQPVSACTHTATENVTLRVKNTGAQQIDTVQFYYVLNNGTPVHETMIHTILPDSSYNYTFTQQANMAVPGTYTYKFYIHLNGDNTASDDTIQNYSVSSGYNLTYQNYTMGFESTENVTGWSKLDVNNDTYTWAYPYSSSTYSHSGSFSARYAYSSANAANDWLFSRCLSMNAGSTYKVEFWYRTYSTSYTNNLELKCGTSASVAGMTIPLTTLSSITNTTYQKASATFVAPTTGSYYFGWHVFSNAGQYYVYIDDINISLMPEQEAAILNITSPVSGCGLSSAEIVTVDIKNTGADTIQGNLTGYYRFNNGSVVSQAIPDMILPGNTTSFTFTQTVDAHVVDTNIVFPIKAWIALTGDPVQTNDTASKSVNSSYVPADPVTISDTVPYGAPAMLTAISLDSVYWYDVPSGGNALAMTHTFITPNLYNMGIYYAEAHTPGGAAEWTFDSDLQGWTVENPCTSTDNWAWDGDNGMGTLHAPDPDDYSYQLVTSPSVSVSGTSTVSLSFNHRYGTEATYDEGYIAYKLDNGPWTQFVPTVNTYNASENVGNDPLNGCASNTKSCYTGTQSTYILSSGVINTAGATNIKLGFVFTSDVSGDDDGWFIDKVTISRGLGGCASARIPDTAFLELYPKEASIIAITSPVGGCSGTMEDISVLIANNGMDTLSNNLSINYTVNGSSVISEAFPGILYPGDTVPFTFTTPLVTGLTPVNNDSTFNLTSYISLSGDPYAGNDTILSVFILQYTPPVPSVVNDTVPYGTSATLYASSPDSVNWYDVPTGGVALSNSHSLVTPLLFNTTVYYAEATTTIEPNIWTFDNDLEGWTASSPCSSPVTWVWSSDAGHGTVYAEDYDGYSSQLLTSPVVSLDGITSMMLSYTHRYSTESGYDHGFVAYKLDAGNWIQFIPTTGSYNTNDTEYKEPLWNSCATSSDMPLYDDVMAYETHSGSINTTGASTIQLAFVFTTDVSGDDDGWYLDDVSLAAGDQGCASARVPDTVFVTGVPACDVSVLAIYEPTSGIELSNAEPVTIKVKNYGSAPAVKIPVHYSINGGLAVNDTIQGPIASGDTSIFTFAIPADLSAYITYSLMVYSDLSCDITTINDTVYKTIINDSLIYCASGANYTSDCDISNVTVSNLNNGNPLPVYSNPSCTATYTNYTALSPVILNSGSIYPISVSQCNTSTTFWGSMVNVYIDYNRNGSFELPAEKVFSASTSSSYPTVSGTFTVPTTGIVTNEPLRMRVVLDESDVAPACGSYYWGETEDYTVIILPQIPNDAGVISVINPTSLEIEGAVVPVQAIIKNFGSDTIHNSSNMVVAYSYNGGVPQSIVWSGGDILPFATDTAVLPNIIVTPFVNNICAWTELTGDTYNFNDTTCKTFTATPLYDAGVTSFLSPSTQLISGDVDTVTVIFKNLGADTLTSMNLVYTLNGAIQGTEAWNGTLLPNATDTVTFAQTFVVPDLGFDLCAYTSLSADANHNNDTLCIHPYGVITSALPFYDNFDGSTVYWSQVAANNTKWELGTPGYGVTNTAHSLPNAWDINLDTSYFSSANAVLYTQYFDFSTAVNARMKFWINYYTENGFDGARIDYTIDSGATWNVLGKQSDPRAVFWYNDDVISSSGKPGWTNSSAGWKYSEYKLDTLNNTPLVRFRFVFTSDGSGNRDGVSVDDFAITLPYPQDAGVEAIYTPAIQSIAGGNVPVKVRIKNFGTDTLHSIPVSYRVGLNGAPVTQVWTGALIPEDTVNITFTTSLAVPTGAFDLYSYTGLVADGDHNNDTALNHITGVPIYDVPFSDNYEGLVTWFGLGTSSLWEWGVPAAPVIDSAYSPTHAWVTNLDGNYTNSSTEYLYSPFFMFTNVDSSYMEFWHWYETESGYDGCRIEYSINGGNWTILGTLNDPNAVNWYNTTVSGLPCWSGSSGGYVHSKFRLTSNPAIVDAVAPVQFRFKFFSDAADVDEGWAVDDFSLTAPPIPQDAGVIAILQPNAATQTGSPVTVQVTIKNFGTGNLTSVPVKYRVNNGAVVTETWAGTIVPGATADYTFTTPYASPASTYNLCAFSKLTGDIYTFNDTTCASFGTTPAPHDVGISSIVSPGLSTIVGQPDSVKVMIKNFGLGIETSIPLEFLRNSVIIGSGVWTGTLNGGDSVLYKFSTVSISPIGNYSLCARTTLTGDANPANDQKCIYPVGHVGIEDYDYNGFSLEQNMPNPAEITTSIVFYIPEDGKVYFTMVDMMGQLVRSEEMDAVMGKNQIDLDISSMADGIYFYSATYKGDKITKRMVINK